jgi:hypothetical protein
VDPISTKVPPVPGLAWKQLGGSAQNEPNRPAGGLPRYLSGRREEIWSKVPFIPRPWQPRNFLRWLPPARTASQIIDRLQIAPLVSVHIS